MDYEKSLENALGIVLMFYQPYSRALCDRWEVITGTREMTTKVMCDHIRKVLGKDENKSK